MWDEAVADWSANTANGHQQYDFVLIAMWPEGKQDLILELRCVNAATHKSCFRAIKSYPLDIDPRQAIEPWLVTDPTVSAFFKCASKSLSLYWAGVVTKAWIASKNEKPLLAGRVRWNDVIQRVKDASSIIDLKILTTSTFVGCAS